MANEYGPYMDDSDAYVYETLAGLRIRPRRTCIRFSPGQVHSAGWFSSGGLYVHANSAHVSVGVMGARVQDDGDLEILTDGPMTPILSNWCSSDETLSVRGIFGGCSVGSSTVARFYKDGVGRLYLNQQADWDLIAGDLSNAWFGWDTAEGRGALV